MVRWQKQSWIWEATIFSPSSRPDLWPDAPRHVPVLNFTAQAVKSTPERAWGLGPGLLLEVTRQNIKMMSVYEDPRSDKAFPGMLPTAKTNSWALSPGALFHVFGLILWLCWGNRRHIYQGAFSAFQFFTDRAGKTVCGSHCQTFWNSKGSYLLTHFSSHFIFYYLICFLVSCLKFLFWNNAVYK